MQVNLGQSSHVINSKENDGEESLEAADSDEHLIEFLNLPNGGQHKSHGSNGSIE
jgi:hypothetical protein